MTTKVDEKPKTDAEKETEENNEFDVPIISDIGIIYPPPEVRGIIERTAEFIHKNGLEFEEKIRQREVQNQKFSFLNRNDPYFMYYKHILYEYTLYPDREKAPKRPSFLPHIVKPEKQIPSQKESQKKSAFRHLIEISECTCPESLDPHEFILEAVPLTLADIDTVKITAQFVARNGKAFMQNLSQREAKNYLFDFLKPQHNIYPFFIKLVEQYAKILAPSNETMKILQNEAIDQSAVLERVKKRYEWFRYNDKERRNETEKSKDKGVHGLVDWHEFVVVETITFREDEQSNLPPPVTLEQLGARIISEERFQKTEKGTKVQQNGVGIDEKKKIEDSQEISETIIMDDIGNGMENAQNVKIPAVPEVRKDYDPKKTTIEKKEPKSEAQEKMMISPITGEYIPASKMEQHLKQSMLDPKYKEQKQKYLEEKRQLNLMATTGPSITAHLKDLAQRRSDIFGPGHEETVIGKKLTEKEAPYIRKSAPVNFEAVVTPSQPKPPQSHRQNQQQNDRNMEPRQLQKTVLDLPPPLISSQNTINYNNQNPTHDFNLPPPIVTTQPWQDGRPKFDEPLIPEDEFLNSYGGIPIHVQVRVPDLPELVQKHGWQLQGQIQHLTVNLSDTIQSLKTQLMNILGIPVTKQKILIGASRFAKDSFTLAYYNVHSNTYIALQLKEREGKR